VVEVGRRRRVRRLVVDLNTPRRSNVHGPIAAPDPYLRNPMLPYISLGEEVMRSSLTWSVFPLIAFVAATPSQACGMFDLHCIAEDAGRQAAIEVAKGMDVATLNARELTNQFGALVSDLYGGNPERAARARAIFTALLGRDLAQGELPHFQLSVVLVGKPNELLDVDTYIFSRDNNEAVKALFANDKSSFNAHRLNAATVEPLTEEIVRKRVFEAAWQYQQQIPPMPWNCANHPEVVAVYPQAKAAPVFVGNAGFGAVSAAPSPCVQGIRAYQLGNLILNLQGTPEAQPINSRHTDDAPGGMVAVLAPRDQLKILASHNPLPRIQIWVHDKDHPEKPTNRFRTADGKSRVPIEVSATEMLTSDKCFDTTRHYGAICFTWVPLRLESIAALPDERK
jgi:hypothetical protein